MSKDKTIIKHVYGNILRVAIPLTIRTRTLQEGVEVETEEDFHPNPNYPTIIDLYKGFGQHYTFDATVEGNVASFIDQGDTPIGIYQVEVTCKDSNGNPVRYMVRAIIEIVDATIDAGIEAGIEFNAESYTLEGAVFFYAKGESLYQLMVEEGRFVGTLEEFLDQYENTLKAASDAAKTTLSTNFQVQDAEELRVTAENERKSAETTRNTKESEREASEEIRNNSESTRVEKENQREASETTRKSNEDARVTAERMRATAEVNRNANETTRQENEETRESHERTRVQNETERQRDEDLRTNAERTRVTAESGRVQAEEARAIQSAADHAQAENDHSASVNATEGAEQVNANLEGSTVTITDRHGNATSVDIGFSIYRTYSSVAEMNADADNVEEGKFVLIATTSPTSTENARLYVRNGNSATSSEPFRFLSDLDQASSEAWANWLENMKPAIESRIATADNDHSQAVSDHGIATADHTQASQDHTVAIGDHTQAENDHSTASQDHTTAVSDHEQALQDHTQANTDHTTAVADHEVALADHEEIDKKANKDGYYGSMTVGTAENLVGRGSVEAEYTGVRTSAGTADIGSGSATIVKMMGNSVKFNQLANVDSYQGTTFNKQISVSYDKGHIIFSSNGTETGTGGYGAGPARKLFANHKYYVKVNGRRNGFFKFKILIGSGIYFATTDTDFTRIVTQSSDVNSTYTFVLYFSANTELLADFHFWYCDLTEIFGEGNEPATVKEFEAWLEENVGKRDYYPYNPGEIINNGATGITTYGFNLYDYATGKAYLPGKYSDYPQEYEICGTFESISYTDINGNTYVPELTDGKFFNVSAPGELTVVGGNNTDTLVHLVWSGWRNEGEPDYAYESFWKHTLPLNLKTRTGKLNGEGESVVVFPYGLAKIGDVQDEIKGNVATKKIGRRAYEDGDESNTSVMTDGTNTQYVLPTPQTYILDEELPSNYRVDDFGTEQAEPAYTDEINAPIRYEVQYAMNAADTLRRLPQNYVNATQVQNFSDAQKAQARQNIGAMPNMTVDDEPTDGSDNLVKSGGVQNELALGAVYDVSAKNPTEGSNNDGKWESLSALLSDTNLNTLIPTAVRKGGMSIKFVQSSDNNYVQYFLTKNTWSANEGDWKKLNLEEEVKQLGQKVTDLDGGSKCNYSPGYYESDGSTDGSNQWFKADDYIPVDAGTIVWNPGRVDANPVMLRFDENKQQLGNGYNANAVKRTITIDSATKYVKPSFVYSNLNAAKIINNGKTIWTPRLGTGEIDYRFLQKVGRFINEDNVWKSGTINCCFLPVTPGQSIFISAGENPAVIAVLKNTVSTIGTTPNFSDTMPGRFLATQGQIITIPDDGQYLYIALSAFSMPTDSRFFSVPELPREKITESNIYLQNKVAVLDEDLRNTQTDINYKNVSLFSGGGINKSNGANTAGSTSRTDYLTITEGYGIFVKGVLGALVTPLALYDASKVFIEAELNSGECFRSADYLKKIGAKYFRCTIGASQVSSGDWYIVYDKKVLQPINQVTNELTKLSDVVNTIPDSAASGSPIRLLDAIGNPLNPVFYQTDESGNEIPTTREVLNVQKKAKQLSDIEWTPLASVPNNNGTFPANVKVKGIPYTSVKECDKYVGWDVSIHTFMTAVNNPYSLLYTENVSAANSQSAWGKTYHGANCSAYFGTVCNEFAKYSAGCDVDFETVFDKWLHEHRLTFAKVFDQSAQGVRIGDIWWQSGHNRIITGVKRNEDGDVTNVIVSEAVNIKVIVTEMTASAFDALIASQHAIIYRSIELYMNRYTPSPYIPLGDEDATPVTYNDDICTFAGDRATFREGDTIVIDYNLKSVGEWTAMELYKNDELVDTITIDTSAHYVNLTSRNLTYGKYKARMKNGSNYSDFTYWEILQTMVSHAFVAGKSSVTFSSNNGKPWYYILGTQVGNRTVMNSLTDNELSAGKVVVDFNAMHKQQRYNNEDLTGTYYLKVKFRGDYGCVTNEPLPIVF